VERAETCFTVMGTEAHLVVLDGPAGAVGWARRRLEELEERWSRFLPKSEISRLNRAGGRPVVVAPETFRLIEAAVEAWRWSGGRFDPTTPPTLAEICENDSPPSTSVGASRLVVLPTPSCPRKFQPQQYASPPDSTPQVYCRPTLSDWKVSPPATGTG